MCLLAVLFRVADDAPVVIGANREEAYDRGGTAPDLRPGPLRFIAGLDPKAGGTWLGVNAAGVVAAVTNRRGPDPSGPTRSRGLLVRDLLVCGTARQAHDRALAELQARTYAPCNLLVADAAEAHVIHAGDWLRVSPLSAGAHVLTNGDVDQAGDVRVRFALDQLRTRSFADADEALAALRRLCSTGDGRVPIVQRREEGGTVSSTLIALRDPLRSSELHHAQGPPDRAPYQDYSDLFVRLAGG